MNAWARLLNSLHGTLATTASNFLLWLQIRRMLGVLDEMFTAWRNGELPPLPPPPQPAIPATPKAKPRPAAPRARSPRAPSIRRAPKPRAPKLRNTKRPSWVLRRIVRPHVRPPALPRLFFSSA